MAMDRFNEMSQKEPFLLARSWGKFERGDLWIPLWGSEGGIRMEKIVARLLDYLCAESIIKEDEREVYHYYFEVSISALGYWVSILAVAIITGRLWESMVYLGTFMLLRGNFGGYHADTHLKCALLSMTGYLLFLLTVAFLPTSWILYVVVMAMASVLLCAIGFAPIDHPNKPFSSGEYQKYRKNSIRMVGILTVGVALGMIMNQEAIVLCVCFGALQAAVSLPVVVWQKRRNSAIGDDCV